MHEKRSSILIVCHIETHPVVADSALMNDDSEEVNWLSSLVEVKEISKWSLDTVWHIQDKFKSYYYMIIYLRIIYFHFIQIRST